MNAEASPTFRGSVQLSELIERMEPLANYLRKFRPECRVLTLSKRDFQVLRKYPEAAQTLHEITTSPITGLTYWRGYWELREQGAPSTPKRQLRP